MSFVSYRTDSTISAERLAYPDRYSARSALSRFTRPAYSSSRLCAA